MGQVFGVSPKTIRDIWVGRTWYRETFHLDPSRTDAHERLGRHIGRPKGVKDSRPRRRKKEMDRKLQVLINETPGQGKNVLTDHALKQNNVLVALNVFGHKTLPPSGKFGKPYADRVQRANSIFRPKSTMAQFLDRVEDFAIGARDPEPDILQWDRVEFCDPFHDDWAFWKPDGLPGV